MTDQDITINNISEINFYFDSKIKLDFSGPNWFNIKESTDSDSSTTLFSKVYLSRGGNLLITSTFTLKEELEYQALKNQYLRTISSLEIVEGE